MRQERRRCWSIQLHFGCKKKLSLAKFSTHNVICHNCRAVRRQAIIDNKYQTEKSMSPRDIMYSLTKVSETFPTIANRARFCLMMPCAHPTIMCQGYLGDKAQVFQIVEHKNVAKNAPLFDAQVIAVNNEITLTGLRLETEASIRKLTGKLGACRLEIYRHNELFIAFIANL